MICTHTPKCTHNIMHGISIACVDQKMLPMINLIATPWSAQYDIHIYTAVSVTH